MVAVEDLRDLVGISSLRSDGRHEDLTERETGFEDAVGHRGRSAVKGVAVTA